MKAPRAWIETVERPGKRKGFKIRWRERVGETWKKRSGELRYNAGEVQLDKQAKDEELAKQSAVQLVRSRGGAMSLSAAFDRWKASRLASGEIRDGYAHEAQQSLQAIMKSTGWVTVDDVTSDALDQWLASKPRGSQKPHMVLRSILHYAHQVLRQPVDTVALAVSPRAPVSRPQPPLLTDEQVQEILDRAAVIGEGFAVGLEHLSLFGCRPVDVCRMQIQRWRSASREIERLSIETKNKRPILHPVPIDHARKLDRIAAGRMPSEHLFLHPSQRPWRMNDNGGAGELTDFYWNNITSKIPGILPDQRGIYCLKDYAITRMELAGIDDKTKTTFTGILTLSVYQRYKATNRTQQDDALAKLERLRGQSKAKGAKSGAKDRESKNGGIRRNKKA